MAEEQIQLWCDDGDRNSEYISIDGDYEGGDVPSNALAMSVAGLFTFFLHTDSAPYRVSVPSSLKSSVALSDFVGMINKARASSLGAALDAATKAYPKIADARDAEVNEEVNGDQVDDETQEDDYFAPPPVDPEEIAKINARKEADRKLSLYREKYTSTTVGLPPPTIERLLRDLAQVQKNTHHGWSAEPVEANLAMWCVKLFDFEKGTPLYDDMRRLRSETSAVTLHMKFPAGYPNAPPFVRVVNPRFMYRTGHVTVGGSICTELLVQEGWQPVFDIEGIIETLRQQITDPQAGARIDFANTNPYTEQEAIEAFNRVAMQHGWSIMK